MRAARCVWRLLMFLRTNRCVSHQILLQAMMRIVSCFVFVPLLEWGAGGVCCWQCIKDYHRPAPDMYVLSGLISTFVCSLRPKGQVTGEERTPSKAFVLKCSLLAQMFLLFEHFLHDRGLSEFLEHVYNGATSIVIWRGLVLLCAHTVAFKSVAVSPQQRGIFDVTDYWDWNIRCVVHK